MTSIQTRLTLWLVGSVVALFGLHWMVTSRAPANITQEYIETRLEHDGEMLLPGISFDAMGRPVIEGYSFAPIYAQVRSGHYYIVENQNHRLRSLSLGDNDISIPWPARGERAFIKLKGPDNESLLVWTACIEHQGEWINIAIAEELTQLNQHLTRFRTRFTAVTLALLFILIVAQHFIVKRSLKPLQDIANDCRNLEAGSIEALPESVPREIRPLVKEVNRLARLMRQRLERSRNAVGNLAHSLKTPLALLTQILHSKQATIAGQEIDQAKTSTDMIGSIIDRELKRARLAGAASSAQTFTMRVEVQSIIDLLKKVHADKQLQFNMAIDQGDLTYGDREDMLELIGNLMENASKWARRRVRISAECNSDLTLKVEDDGPGIEPVLRERLTQRGMRADESKSGHGLGLSIVKDVVTQYHGNIAFKQSADLGGLCVEIHLPTATNCRK